jgi:hypothetical protein
MNPSLFAATLAGILVAAPALAADAVATISIVTTAQVVTMQGNNVGTYTVAGLTAQNVLLYGFASLSGVITQTAYPYNYAEHAFNLIPQSINTARGWYINDSGQIVDPVNVGWVGYDIVWFIR